MPDLQIIQNYSGMNIHKAEMEYDDDSLISSEDIE